MRFAAVVAATIGAAAIPPMVAMTVTRHIPLADGGWDYVSFDAASHRLFIGRGTGATTVDIAAGSVREALAPATRGHQALTLGTTGIAALTSTAAGGVLLFDATTGAVTATVKTGPKPDAAIWDEAAQRLYVMDNAGGGIAVVDPVKRAVEATIAIPGALESVALGGHGRLYVNVEDKGALVTVDLAARTVVGTTSLGCEEPNGLALTKSGTLIAACASKQAKFVDAATGKVTGGIAIGPGSDTVLYDPARDRAYIPTSRDGMMTVLDTAAPIPIKLGAVVTAPGARTGAIDPATGAVYLVAAKYAAAIGAERPKALSGSVEVIELR